MNSFLFLCLFHPARNARDLTDLSDVFEQDSHLGLSSSQSVQAGTLIDGKYQLISKLESAVEKWPPWSQSSSIKWYVPIKELGHGAFGETWLASESGTPRAIKFLCRSTNNGCDFIPGSKPVSTNDIHMLDLARQECNWPKKITTNAGRFAQCLKDETRSAPYAYIVQEVAGTHSMSQAVGPLCCLHARHVFKMAIFLLQGLSAMEGKVVHADIKEDNIMVKIENSEVVDLKYIDFGLMVDENTQTGTRGTPVYLPPETWPVQLKEGYPYTHAVDVYGAGSTLYSLMCGVPWVQEAMSGIPPAKQRNVNDLSKILGSMNPLNEHKCKYSQDYQPLFDLVVRYMIQPKRGDRKGGRELLQRFLKEVKN